MNSQVFVPVQDEKAPVPNIQRSTRAQPLVLSAEDGTPVLVLFSSPERTKPFIEDLPGFQGGILEPFTWVLENMGSKYGIALNPGSELGFDMEPETVKDLPAASCRAEPILIGRRYEARRTIPVKFGLWRSGSSASYRRL